jgi:DNA-binding NtrC family response regulator
MDRYGRTPQIVLVDDDVESCRVLAELLCLEGFAPRPYIAAEAAWQAMTSGELQPDLALVDVRMPEVNGVALLQRIKARFPAIPVFLMSAFPDERLWAEGLRAGALDVFPKPIHARSLVRALQQVLERSGTAPRPAGENPGPPQAGALPRRES